jgi:hypothetical protein
MTWDGYLDTLDGPAPLREPEPRCTDDLRRWVRASFPAAYRNVYQAKCRLCGYRVAPGEGIAEHHDDGWRVICA